MKLAHAHQIVARRLLRASPEMWTLEGEERREVEEAIAVGVARKAWRWSVREDAWLLEVWLPQAQPEHLRRANEARRASVEAPAAPLAVPRMEVPPEPRFGRAVRRVYREPARATAGPTLVPYEPARWLE